MILDTAGRLAIDEKMMKEIEGLKKNLKPHETLFVLEFLIQFYQQETILFLHCRVARTF